MRDPSTNRNRHRAGRVLGRRGAVAVSILLGAVILVWITGRLLGWSSVGQYGEGLVWAGILVVGFGLLGIRGEWEVTRSFPYQYSMSVTDQPGWERSKHILEEGMRSHGFLIEMLAAGGLCIVIGWLIESLTL